MIGQRAKISWALYDFANSSFSSLVTTFIFATYFIQSIAPDVETGTSLWGLTMGLAGLIIALTSPVTGAIADQTGKQKPWLAFFTIICITSTAALWFAKPETDSILLAMLFVLTGTVGMEVGCVFYNSMLPNLASPKQIGRLSGYAWGLGYAGGLVCLIISLNILINVDVPPFGMKTEHAEPIRASMLLTAIWFALFSLPLFLFTPDNSKIKIPIKSAIKNAFLSLLDTFKGIRNYSNAIIFLVARMAYIDGVNTMFAFGGIYAAGTFGMDITSILMFGITLNITAGLGAVIFGWVDDYFGPKKTLIISLIFLIITSIGVLIAQTVFVFWFISLFMTLFFGPIQSSSRTLMIQLAPKGKNTEMFGLYAVSGKITSFLGPFAIATITMISENQRAGMSVILVFLFAGLFLLTLVKDKKMID